MFLAINPNDSPTPRREPGDDDLERLYKAVLSHMEGLLDPGYGWTDDEAFQIDDMIVQFRIWGIELDIKSGTLRWLQHDYLKEAAAIRVNLQAVRSSLTRFISHMSRELEVEVKAEAETETDNTVKTGLEDTRLTLLGDLTRCVEGLCDLSESLQIVISLHTKQGPAARVKEFMNARKLASTSIELPESAVKKAQDAEIKLASDYAEPVGKKWVRAIFEAPALGESLEGEDAESVESLGAKTPAVRTATMSAETYEIEILNSYGSSSGRNYCVYFEAPEISGGRLQQSDASSLVCGVAGPIENGGRKHFSYKTRYFGFIGRTHVVDSQKIVKFEMEREVKLGDDRNSGTCLDARVPDRGGLMIESSTDGSTQGSFTIRCLDRKPAPHNVVVGLAQEFDGTLVPVSAVPYAHGVAYTIKPKSPIYIVREGMVGGQVIPRNILSSGQPVVFRGSQVKAQVTENNVGQFSVSMIGYDSTTAGSRSTTSTAQQQPSQKLVAIAVMGITGSGKSTLIKEVTGQDVPVGSGIDSTTTQVKIYTATLDGQEVLFVDTPGFDDSKKTEGEILQNITTELARLYAGDIRISGVIYIHDIMAERLTGTARRYLEMFVKIVGPNAMRNVALLTTKWDRVPEGYRVAKEQMLKDGPWKELIRNGASVRRIGLSDGRGAYKNIAKEVLRNVAATLQIQQELVDQRLPLNETSAGRMLDEQIQEATKVLRKEVDEVNQKLASAESQHGRQVEELRQILEIEKRALRQEMQQLEQGRNALQQQFDKGENKVKELQQIIDELRRQQQQQPPPPPVPQPVSPSAYDISVHYRNSGSTLILMDKTCHQNGSWTAIPDGQKLTIPWSGNSGLLRFQLSSGEQIAVAVGVHNYVRWCDISTGLKPNETTISRHVRYYNGSDSKHDMVWKQALSWNARTPGGKAITVSYYVADGHDLHTTLNCS